MAALWTPHSPHVPVYQELCLLCTKDNDQHGKARARQGTCLPPTGLGGGFSTHGQTLTHNLEALPERRVAWEVSILPNGIAVSGRLSPDLAPPPMEDGPWAVGT